MNQRNAQADLAQLREKARAAESAGLQEAAIQAWTGVLDLAPDDLEALLSLAFERLRIRRFSDAESDFKALVQCAPADGQVHFGLAMALYEQQKLEESLASLETASSLDPGFVHAWLYAGAIHERLAREERALGCYLRAVRLVHKTDVRQIPEDVRRFLTHASSYVRERLSDQLAKVFEELSARHGRPALARIAHAAAIFTGHVPKPPMHPKWRPGFFCVPDLQPRRFLEREEFGWVEDVESKTQVVRQEYLSAIEDGRGFNPYIDYPEGSHQAQAWQTLNRSMDWSTLHLHRHGMKNEVHCQRCPETAAMLESVVDLHRVPGYGPEVMFSVLNPKTRIPPHYGSVNGRLVVHLPLVVPGKGYLRVGDECREWEEGRLLIFDDTFEHEAYNGSDLTRIVLIFDIWNPQLSIAEREAFAAVLAVAQQFESSLLS